MTTPARRIGTIPTLGDRVVELERLAAEQQGVIDQLMTRLEALEVLIDPEEGQPDARLSPSWHAIKRAAPIAGFSQSGMRKAMARARRAGERPWWCYRAGRLMVDVDACPWPVTTGANVTRT